MATRANDSFLGTGWSFPPTFSKASSSVILVSDERDIRESLLVLFLTAKRQRVMLPEYGCDIWLLVFSSFDTNFKTQAIDYISQAMLDWEPRVNFQAADIQRDPNVDGLIHITVDYQVRATNSRDNIVFPFYLQEGSLVPDGG